MKLKLYFTIKKGVPINWTPFGFIMNRSDYFATDLKD